MKYLLDQASKNNEENKKYLDMADASLDDLKKMAKEMKVKEKKKAADKKKKKEKKKKIAEKKKKKVM